jgi:hypothetical protein
MIGEEFLSMFDAFPWIFVPSTMITPTFTSPASLQSASTSPNKPASAVSCRAQNSAIVE